MRIITLVLLLLVSGCAVSLFKYNPLNGCGPRPAGVMCPPNRDAGQEYDFEYKKITNSNTNQQEINNVVLTRYNNSNN